MPDILQSKKFQALIVGFVVLALVTLVPGLEPLEEHLTEIVSIVVAYILGQGLADIGKFRPGNSSIHINEDVLTGHVEYWEDDEVATEPARPVFNEDELPF